MRYKDAAAVEWCKNATELTGTTWRYRKVPQSEFEALAPKALCDLAGLFG